MEKLIKKKVQHIDHYIDKFQKMKNHIELYIQNNCIILYNNDKYLRIKKVNLEDKVFE